MGYLEKEDIEKYIMPLMEVRNKFLHILELNTFEKAVTGDLLLKIIKHNTLHDEGINLEGKIFDGYICLTNKTVEILKRKTEIVKNERALRREGIEKLTRAIILARTSYQETINDVVNKIQEKLNEGTIDKDVALEIATLASESYNNYLESPEQVSTIEYIQSGDFKEALNMYLLLKNKLAV